MPKLLIRIFQAIAVSSFLSIFAVTLHAEATNPGCALRSTTYQGWQARELSNASVTLTFIPQLGGRLMQVAFQGHPFLFVNPRYRGQYISPEQAHGTWINYGGDKVWPMPEGNSDDHHWVLASTAIDDLPYTAKVWTEKNACSIKLTGAPDTITGIQYIRTITLSALSPEIRFHAVMVNASTHPITWSMQSVTQYDLANPQHTGDFNHDFWAYTPVNTASTYPGGFHVRSGLADDPSFSVVGNQFSLHWLPLANEVWLDTPAGWLAIVDKTSGFAMIERFTPHMQSTYPDRTSVIFYKNGPSVRFDERGHPFLPPADADAAPAYMEAEINSPLVSLRPGERYAMDTIWNPTQMKEAPRKVTSAGVLTDRLQFRNAAEATATLTASFSPFYRGDLTTIFYDAQGKECGRSLHEHVSAGTQVLLKRDLIVPPQTYSIRLLFARESSHRYEEVDRVYLLPKAGEPTPRKNGQHGISE